jgi:hypothetical protein
MATYVIIDLREIMIELSKDRNKYHVYRHFPIKDIISTFLSIPIYTHYKEAVYLESEMRFNGLNLTCDQIFELEKHYDFLVYTIDKYVVDLLDKVNKEWDTLVLERWVDNTSVMLRTTELTNRDILHKTIMNLNKKE